MEFCVKGPMDSMDGHFSPINRLESVNGIQFSLCGTSTNLIFAHRVACTTASVMLPKFKQMSSPYYVTNSI